MKLKEYKTEKTVVKCTCDLCRGTGVIKPLKNEDHIGFICNNCYGRGFTLLNLEGNNDLFQDEETKDIYLVTDAMLNKRVELFQKREEKDGIDFVTYFQRKEANPENVVATSIIPYERFKKGEYPLPNEVDNCPREFTLLYGSTTFENGCENEDCTQCSKYQSGECWDTFYGDALTPDELQHVLRKIKDYK